MGFLDDLFGSPEPVGPSPAELREQMALSAQEAEPFWRNYLGFRADAERRYEAGVQDIDQRERFGSLSGDAAEAARAQLEQERDSAFAEIQRGATWEYLQGEFDRQRTFAREQFDQEQRQERFAYEAENAPGRFTLTWANGDVTRNAEYFPAVGGDIQTEAGYRDAEGNRVTGKGRELQSAVANAPWQSSATFDFASDPSSYFGTMFGTEARPAAPGGARTGNPRDLRRAGGGAPDQDRGIGVGRVYSWY